MPQLRHRSGTAAATPKRRWSQRFVLVMGCLSVLGCLSLAAGVGWIYWKTGRFKHADVNLDEVASATAPRNYLIIGSDSREVLDDGEPGSGGGVEGRRADVILVVRVDPGAGTVQMLSIPRDLWVPIAGTAHSAKINSAYSEGNDLSAGAQALINTVRQQFGIPINNYLDVNFDTFRSAIDEVGGVDMWFDRAVRDGNTGLNVAQPGCVHLDGTMALALARSRHIEFKTAKGWQEDQSQDLGRITRQHILIRKAIGKALGADFTNPLKASKLLDIAVQNVVLDQTLNRDGLLDLVQRFKGLDPDAVATYSLPVDNVRVDGQAALRLQAGAARPVLNLFRGQAPGAVAEKEVSVDVRNASGVAGRGQDVSAALTTVGFDASVTNGKQTRRPATLVRYAPGSEAAADLVARHLGTPPTFETDAGLPADTVRLYLGTDFTTVTRTPAAPGANPGPPAPTTTTPAPSSSSASPGGAAPSTTLPPTNEVGISTGEPPAGVVC